MVYKTFGVLTDLTLVKGHKCRGMCLNLLFSEKPIGRGRKGETHMISVSINTCNIRHVHCIVYKSPTKRWFVAGVSLLHGGI